MILKNYIKEIMKMGAKFAYTVWQWGAENKEQMIQGIKDIHEVGFEYFESTKPFIDLFKDDDAGFEALCDEYNVRPVGAYFHLNGTKENDIDDIEAKIPFMLKHNMYRMSLQGLGAVDRRATPEEMKYTVDTINKIGEICKPYGICPCVHPHYNTSIMIEKEIDFVMKNTDPACVFFGPDTAHLTASGCDAVEIYDRYKDRIRFTHLKDIDMHEVLKSEGMEQGKEVYSNFRELGQGTVNFKGVFDVLKSVNYDGYLCAELDRSRFGNKESAAMSLKYLKENW